MSKRPSIDLVLNVRSTERIVVVSDLQDPDYPENWEVMQSDGSTHIDVQTVVIIDHVDVSRDLLADILRAGPRIVGMLPTPDEEHGQEKRFRRNLRGLYPWSEVWEAYTDFGKVLMSCPSFGHQYVGRPYDRDTLVDMRQVVSA